MIIALLDVLYGERCARCAAPRASCPWVAAGPRVPGLRAWDAPHLCAACAVEMAGACVAARVPASSGDPLAIYAARREDAALVDLVGALKYRGLRGLAWPLGRLLVPAATTAAAHSGPVEALIALPLHPRRRRARGFNQAELLARVVAREVGLPVLAGCVQRRRATSQQAALAAGDTPRRRGNVADAFVASPPAASQPRRVALVDDLVTTGATWAEAARALNAAGWDVRWGLALGVAARLAPPAGLDTIAAGL